MRRHILYLNLTAFDINIAGVILYTVYQGNDTLAYQEIVTKNVSYTIFSTNIFRVTLLRLKKNFTFSVPKNKSFPKCFNIPKQTEISVDNITLDSITYTILYEIQKKLKKCSDGFLETSTINSKNYFLAIVFSKLEHTR
jgi:hypothetical protein